MFLAYSRLSGWLLLQEQEGYGDCWRLETQSLTDTSLNSCAPYNGTVQTVNIFSVDWACFYVAKVSPGKFVRDKKSPGWVITGINRVKIRPRQQSPCKTSLRGIVNGEMF